MKQSLIIYSWLIFFTKVYADFFFFFFLDYFLRYSTNVLHNGTHGIDIVYVGGVELNNTYPESLLYGIDLTGTEVSAISTQLAAGVQAVHDSTNASTIKSYSYHFCNGHLSTVKVRRNPGSKFYRDQLTVVTKYGQHKTATQVLSETEVISAQWIKSNTKCVKKEEIIPIGNWDLAAGYISFKGCADSISDSLLELGTKYANRAIGNLPNQDTWKADFSHGSWNVCMKIANKLYYLLYDFRNAVNSTGKDFKVPYRHDEL